ncbi:MEDS domain-containing protein [Streptomyces sp. NEAU-W12]|uniref:MEDS domain-containing protein n=1 Tax=Streptomyces sp. NEAU-W12 TaxID=2994668 RepID=UPI00224AA448|nr:MEDS domain-containing protein [Streptomyces sp. NEAU-W12]MCX2926309.1 MEDS domain-containing protein [Streptomyces sp. NEAU-W12]
MITYEGTDRRVQDMDHGDHLCLAFTDDAEQRRVVTAYLTSGLHRGERIMYFADQLTPQEVLGWLAVSGTDPRPALEKGQLVVTTADDSYLAAGSFDADGMVAALRQEVRESLRAGYAGLRVSGEMGWVLRQVPGADRLADYETKVNQVFAGQRASAVCQYDARRFSPDQLDHLHGCHPGAVEPEPLYHDSTLRLVPSFRGGRRSLRVVGSVDHRTADALADALETALAWPGDIQVDMRALEFIDLSGVRVLARAAARLEDGRRLHVVELAPLLCQVISMVGFDETPALVVTAQEVLA